MPEKAIDSTEIIPFDPKNAPDHWHDGPALPEPLYGGCLGKAIKEKIILNLLISKQLISKGS